MKNIIKRLIPTGRIATQIAEYIVKNSKYSRDYYGHLKVQFIRNGKGHKVNEQERKKIIERFEEIDRNVISGTSSTDGLFLAEMLLNMQSEGCIVECGCFKGASSSKLSIIAKSVDKKLKIFDSFEGLPESDSYNIKDHHCRRGAGWTTEWTAGRYEGKMEEVKENIKRYGEIECCEFTKGWFRDTLIDSNLPDKISLAFVDVDVASSAKDCITGLWPKIDNMGIFVTHDTAYIKVLKEFYNPELWNTRFKSFPPIIYGGGYGLCNSSPHMGYMVKGMNLNEDYLKAITLNK